MARNVAPWWADGLLCPRCGRPLRWLGEWRGPEFVRRPVEVMLDRRASRDDVPEKVVVGRSGLEAKMALRFRHSASLECVPCCALFSEDQARRGTLEDSEYPPSYFVAGDQPALGTANGVQTGGQGTAMSRVDNPQVAGHARRPVGATRADKD